MRGPSCLRICTVHPPLLGQPELLPLNIFLIVVDEVVGMKKASEPVGDTYILRHVGGIEKELGYKG